jgi:signal transduction histidine kinase
MTAPRRWWPSTIRVRLTLLYAVAFFLAGVAIVALMYLYLGQTLNHQLTVRGDLPEQTLRHLSPDVHDALMAQFQRARVDTLNTMLIASLILLGLVGVIAGGFGWFLAGRALRPLRQITATARRIADQSLHERVALLGPNDEIKELADTFDAMLERLDRFFDSQRRFVANASHELRTPLTINRTLIEVALGDPHANESLRQLGVTLLAVNERHERLIDGLLTLATSEQGVAERTPVDLATIARHVIAESQGTAQSAGVEIRAHLQSALVAGDPALLEQLIQNLVDNAIRYNLSIQGWVSVTSDKIDDDVYLTVENTGSLVPSSDVRILFEPFRRLPTTERLAESTCTSNRRGAGLGLSIVRSVARAHGGDVHASPREGGGLTVHVRIPVVSERSMRSST